MCGNERRVDKLREKTNSGRLPNGAINPATGKRYKRRMTEQKLQGIADSAVLKVAQYVITGIFVPLLLWAVYTVSERLSNIESGINKSNTINATVELRLQSIERTQNRSERTLDMLTERTVEHGYRIRRLEEKTGDIPMVMPQAKNQ